MASVETESARPYTSKQMGDACEMLVAAELTLAGIPALIYRCKKRPPTEAAR
jgi:hypothetical protein